MLTPWIVDLSEKDGIELRRNFKDAAYGER
jgi:hypothetical protein